MRYVRTDLSAGEFRDSIKTGMITGWILAIVYMAILAAVIFPLTSIQNSDRHKERNIYFAIAGREVPDKRAKTTSTLIRDMYGEGIRSLDAFSSIDFGKYAPNSLKSAVDHANRIEEVVKNPARVDEYAERYAPLVSWWSRGKLYASLAGFGIWLILALSVSIGYVRYTRERGRETARNWWRYPWRRRFGYCWIPLMTPYIISIQFCVFMVYVARQVSGADQRERARGITARNSQTDNARTKEQAARKAYDELVDHAELSLPESYGHWNKMIRDSLQSAKREAEEKCLLIRGELGDLGNAIAEKQRELASTTVFCKRLEEGIKGREGKTLSELDQEFTALRTIKGVRALRVLPRSLEVFYDTIYIKIGMETFEIGDFLVMIETHEKGVIKVQNLRNTGNRSKDHPFWQNGSFCFGANASNVQDALMRRDFIPLVIFIYEALQSSANLTRENLKNWRLVQGR